MNKFFELEARKHGSSLFPFASYHLEYKRDTTVLDCHWHSEIEFLIVTYGSGVFQLGDKSFILNRGDGIIINAGCLHSGKTAPGRECSFNAIVFSPDLLQSHGQDIVQIDHIDPVLTALKYMKPTLDAGNSQDQRILKLLSQVIESARLKNDCYELKIKIQLLELFLELNARLIDSQDEVKIENHHGYTPKRAQNIKEALRFIHQNYIKGFTLHEAAAAARLSDAHFSRVFKGTVQMTVLEYLHYYRINQAETLLKNTNLSLIQISREVGYESVNYFIRRFKKLKGCTPGQFRKTP